MAEAWWDAAILVADTDAVTSRQISYPNVRPHVFFKYLVKFRFPLFPFTDNKAMTQYKTLCGDKTVS